MRIGLGYDIHRLVEGRPLFLGGVRIEHSRGLLGHSDGDVICHAIADALLGAAGLGDIGQHFAPGDPQWEGVRGPVLLSHVRDLLKNNGLCPDHVDVTAVLEEPKLAPFIEPMRQAISVALGTNVSATSVKATTNEGLGLIGQKKAIAALAVASVVSWKNRSSAS
jgi:2-C-methyl-D-erythritol 2,4-cyclodiphosphate synthase